MSKVSFIHYWGDRMELQEAQTGLKPRLTLPLPDVTDTLHDDIFKDAQERLGFEDLETAFEDGQTKLIAPDGYMFQVTGAFTLWPDGSHFDWGNGPPGYSYEQWRLENAEELANLEKCGFSPEEAEREIAAWETGNFSGEPPSLASYHGKSVSLAFDNVTWGAVVDPNKKQKHSSDENPATVMVTVNGFTRSWHEQAVRYIQLPNSKNDRMLTTHRYGMPGVIPCWQGTYAVGDIEHMQVELVPIDEEVADSYTPVMNRIWVPDSVRWSVYEDYPDLIDQGGDYNNRSGFGAAMRILGGLATAAKGVEGNLIDDLAAKPNLAVIDDAMFAHMDTGKLVEMVEKLIAENNAKEPGEDSTYKEREANAQETFDKKKKQLAVVTDLKASESLHDVVRSWSNDEWLMKNARFESLLL